ncbi:MAG: hypothetical protein A2122_02215 [Candidatus Liptonbacteria bacterium GWB1_49_6]|uniref:Uncharacterized protein n=1 Tax=Candidatus Liptonbacteria bacterium GWB1_49_6 TaxID=1798644 RepID=A0A1G2C6T8_9BACT|nr:MAG: hypothetical protein A2122_02215 [Candidatus Liptonbacteria bacterium GWB1_49_6]
MGMERNKERTKGRNENPSGTANLPSDGKKPHAEEPAGHEADRPASDGVPAKSKPEASPSDFARRYNPAGY